MLLPLLLLSLCPSIFASFAGDEAFDIVIKRDLKRMWDYTSPYEVTEWVVEAACHHFPELKPTTDEEMIRLKREFMPFLTEMAQNVEALKGAPSKFKIMNAKVAQLYEIAKREFPKLPEKARKLTKNENLYLYYQFILYPVRDLIEMKIESYEKRKFTKSQIKEEIEKIQFDLIYKYHKDDPENPYSEEIEMEKLRRSKVAAASRPSKREKSEVTKEMLEYSSIPEAINSVIDDICIEYPQLHPGDEKKMIILKREAFHFLQASTEVQQEVYAGFPSQFRLLPTVMKKAKKIGISIEPANEEEENMKTNFEVYYILDQIVFKPLLNHIEWKKEYYAKQGMTKEEIKKDTLATQIHLVEVLLKDDADPELMQTVQYNILKNEL